MCFPADFVTLAFFGGGDPLLLHIPDCCLASRSKWYNQVSSVVIILLRNVSPSFFNRRKNSLDEETRLCFHLETAVWAPIVHKLFEVKIFCNDLMSCRDTKVEFISNLTHSDSPISITFPKYRFSYTGFHFLWPSFSIVVKNISPSIFKPLMPFVYNCPRHMWAISSSIYGPFGFFPCLDTKFYDSAVLQDVH